MMFKLIAFWLLVQLIVLNKIISIHNEIYSTFPTQNVTFPNDPKESRETFNTFYGVSLFGPVDSKPFINHNKTLVQIINKAYECYKITSDIYIGISLYLTTHIFLLLIAFVVYLYPIKVIVNLFLLSIRYIKTNKLIN